MGLAALLSIGVIAFYVLSVGPAARLCRSAQGSWCAPGGSAQSALESFYAPVLWLHERTRLRGVLDWYVQDLWGAE